MARQREFDLAGMSLSSYCVSLHRPERRFVSIPVLPSRFFRHSSIYIHAASGIREPRDLIGKRIAIPEYQMTAPVWIRGILSDHYGVPVDAQPYLFGGEEETGRIEKMKLALPRNIRVRPIGPARTLSQMLHDGELDALYTAHALVLPARRRPGQLENYVEVERAYYCQTSLFPIMHTVVMRREVYEVNRWIAQSLTKAFIEAQKRTYADLYETAALKAMLPWMTSHVEEARRELGEDWWSYGPKKNLKVLDNFTRYHHEQGLSPRKLDPVELFAPESLEAFKI